MKLVEAGYENSKAPRTTDVVEAEQERRHRQRVAEVHMQCERGLFIIILLHKTGAAAVQVNV